MDKDKYQNILDELGQRNKKTIVSLSTTANINNKEYIISSIRETEKSVAVNFILRNNQFLDEIINFFDGKIDYFLLDTEIKNELNNLAESAIEIIKKTKVITYKPNDFTIASLDTFLSVKYAHLFDKKILVIGTGNIGIKSAIMLSEKSAKVYLLGRSKEKTAQIVESLNQFIRAKHKILAITQLNEQISVDITIGCSNGTPVIDLEQVSKTKELIIDAGNGTVSEKAIAYANKMNIPIMVLSSTPGYIGFIENLEKTEQMQSVSGRIRITTENYIITPGLLGAKGDILVDNTQNPQKILAVCDGKGDVLYQQDANEYIEKIIKKMDNKELANQIEKIYFKKLI